MVGVEIADCRRGTSLASRYTELNEAKRSTRSLSYAQKKSLLLSDFLNWALRGCLARSR